MTIHAPRLKERRPLTADAREMLTAAGLSFRCGTPTCAGLAEVIEAWAYVNDRGEDMLREQTWCATCAQDREDRLTAKAAKDARGWRATRG